MQRKVDEGEFARRGGRIEEVEDTTLPGFPETTTESNEFLLWNYLVARPEPQAEHAKYLADRVLAAGRWPAMLRADRGLRVGIVGGASSSGGAAIATPMSVARAERVKASLVSGGIEAGRVVTKGVGSRHPFADETSSENMARNRRVEVFLFRPTARATPEAARQAGVAVTVSELKAGMESATFLRQDKPNQFRLDAPKFSFTATVDATGPADMQLGIVQFLRADSRVGSYDPLAGKAFLLDFGRCVQPDLPCRDVGESRGQFSGSGRVNGPRKGTVSMADTPSVILPTRVSDPTRAELTSAHWRMEFIAVLGAQLGDKILPLKSVAWFVEDDHTLDRSSGQLVPTHQEAKADPAADGAPADLDFASATSGRTCRFIIRRITHDFCRPEVV